MAVHIVADDSERLLAALKKAIDDKKIRTWSYDQDGDFTHTAEQWKGKAWLRPNTVNGEAVFNLIGPANTVMTKAVYAVYHGRFIETVLSHFDEQVTQCSASALGEPNDNFETT